MAAGYPAKTIDKHYFSNMQKTNLKKIIISDPEKLEKTKERMKQGGAEKLHVLADFDRTFTKAFVNGEEVTALIAILYKENYLTPDYPKKAQAMFDYYHPIEIDPKIPTEEKREAMKEWWIRHFDLLTESGLKKKDINKAMNSAKSEFRKDALEIMDFLREKNIPLVFLSSSGLGADSIAMRLRKEERLHDNMHIVCNEFDWDENGNFVRAKEPIIHCMNKNEVLLKDFPFFDKIKNRKNVLVLGDNIEDIDMIEGFDYENLISVGFLNKKIEENLENYKKAFDVVIAGDGGMTFVFGLVKELAG